MESSDQEIQAKQALLQSEIIDKNLDKGSFINFCLSKKENGDDLNNWTLQELEEIVKEFVESQTQTQVQSQPSTQKGAEGEDLNKENLEKMEKFNADEPKTFKEKTINCRRLEKSQLNDKKITITVKNPKEMDGGVFGKNYVLYEVQTDPIGWIVTRRFSDFDVLRALLVKYFPSYNIPPLPNKKMGNRRFDLDFIMKRMKFLNLFINNVVQSEDFKASEILIAFLSYTDRGKFESKIKEYQSQIPSAYVEDYKTLEGKVIISHDEGNEKYFTNISKYFRLQSQIFQKLNLSLKNFYRSMTSVCESLEEVHKYFEIMHVLNTRVLMKQTITKSFEELGFFFDNWKKVLIKQKEMVKNHMKDFYKYVNFEGRAYTELIDRREDLKNKYNAEVARVTAKKEKIFATADLNKFELGEDKNVDRDRLLRDKPYAFEHMCRNDNLNLEKMADQLGYANKMNMIELKKMIKEYCTRYVENIKAFDAEFYPTINDMVGTWSNMETFVMSAAMENAKIK
jgi:sorting nexin-7/30/sorting nexin-8